MASAEKAIVVFRDDVINVVDAFFVCISIPKLAKRWRISRQHLYKMIKGETNISPKFQQKFLYLFKLKKFDSLFCHKIVERSPRRATLLPKTKDF